MAAQPQSQEQDQTQPPNQQRPFFTTQNGAPVANPNASQRIGNQLRATLLLQDIHLLEVIQHLTHERIPERFVHARGNSAHGFFEVTHDISDVTSAAFLNKVGKKTRLFTRFSTTGGRAGSAETVRDTRGFAFKLYTEEGNLDWLFLSTPVFSIRDGGKFPSLVHATKKNPRTNLPDPTMLWDFFSSNPETNHFLMFLHTDRATPEGYQTSEVFSINTYRFTKPDGSFVYVKIHMKPERGVQTLTRQRAEELAGIDPEYHTRSIYEDIKNQRFPEWKVFAQIVEPWRAEALHINVFDPTKTLPFEHFPLREFGRIVLNRNVDNFFAEAEQSAFSPTNLVPGWALTPDPILQTRALAYPDTQRYRLGVNFIQLPINRPIYSYNPLMRDGACTIENLGDAPGYFPNSFIKLGKASQLPQPDEENFRGTVVSFESEIMDADFLQARIFWRKTLAATPGDQDSLVGNVAASLHGAIESVRKNSYDLFTRIDADLGRRVRAETEKMVKEAAEKQMVKPLKTMSLTNGHGLKKVDLDDKHNGGMFAHKSWDIREVKV